MQNYQFNTKLAQEIVQRTMSIIDCNINIMNAKGVIIASGQLERIGEIHDGALVVLSQGRIIEINENKSGLLGTKPGINLPLRSEGKIIGVIGLTGDPASIREFAELVCMTAEMMLEQANLLKVLAQDSRLREEFILNLIHSPTITNEITEWAHRLKINLNIPRVACIIEIKSYDLSFNEIKDKFQQIQELLMTTEKGNLIATLSLSRLVVLKPILNKFNNWESDKQLISIRSLINKINDDRLNINVSLGNYFNNEDNNIALSYHTAKTALEVGKSRSPTKQIYNYQELILPVLLNQFKDGWQKNELSRFINKLNNTDSNGILRKTLFTWFENNMQAVSTSKALYIHRNSLEYRLNKIAKITGLNLDKTEDKVLLYIALNIMM